MFPGHGGYQDARGECYISEYFLFIVQATCITLKYINSLPSLVVKYFLFLPNQSSLGP